MPVLAGNKSPSYTYNCMAYAKLKRPDLKGKLRTRDGYARTVTVTTQEPSVGAIAKTMESRWGHVVYVERVIYEHGTATWYAVDITATNERPGHVTRRTIYRSQNKVKGFIS